MLRFYCVWDNRQNLYGDRRPFRLHFYLEDHTTEILEVHEQNPGRDRFPVFLQRCQLPKVLIRHICMCVAAPPACRVVPTYITKHTEPAEGCASRTVMIDAVANIYPRRSLSGVPRTS